MGPTELQQQLFARLKEQLPPHLSVVDELGELLGLSADSVYRRLRGEKPVTLHELKTICTHYKLSLDQLLQLQTDSVLFQAPGLSTVTADHLEYMKGLLAQVRYFNSFRQVELSYLCKDAPVWYFYLFPAMASFKTFFWSRTINNNQQLAGKQYSISEYPFSECFTIGQEIISEYNKIPSAELWNLESIHSTINQVAYYRDAGIFKSREDLEAVVSSFLQLLDHLQLQAEVGRKFLPGDGEAGYRSSIDFYVNELILGNNTLLLNLDGMNLSALSYSVLQYLITRDERFTKRAKGTFDTLLSRSTLISKTGEKDRIRFFNSLRQKVSNLLNN